MDYDPTVLDGLPPLPKDMEIGEMIRLVNHKHAEIRQLDRAIARKMADAALALRL